MRQMYVRPSTGKQQIWELGKVYAKYTHTLGRFYPHKLNNEHV